MHLGVHVRTQSTTEGGQPLEAAPKTHKGGSSPHNAMSLVHTHTTLNELMVSSDFVTPHASIALAHVQPVGFAHYAAGLMPLTFALHSQLNLSLNLFLALVIQLNLSPARNPPSPCPLQSEVEYAHLQTASEIHQINQSM